MDGGHEYIVRCGDIEPEDVPSGTRARGVIPHQDGFVVIPYSDYLYDLSEEITR